MAALIAVVVFASIALFSNFYLFSVLLSMIGLSAVGWFVPHGSKLIAKPIWIGRTKGLRLNPRSATEINADSTKRVRHLVLVLGDQLSMQSAAYDRFDEKLDRVWMAENDEEATHVWCHKYRLVAFFAPMRHFAEEVKKRGYPLDYHALSADRRQAKGCSFSSLLAASIKLHRPEKVVVLQPGDFRVLQSLQQCCLAQGVELEVREDRDFFCSIERFQQWASGRKSMVLEQFYRVMRTEHDS